MRSDIDTALEEIRVTQNRDPTAAEVLDAEARAARLRAAPHEMSMTRAAHTLGRPPDQRRTLSTRRKPLSSAGTAVARGVCRCVTKRSAPAVVRRAIAARAHV